MTPQHFNMLRIGFYRRARRQLEKEAHWITVLINTRPMRGKNAHTFRVEELIGFSPEQLADVERRRQQALKEAREKKQTHGS